MKPLTFLLITLVLMAAAYAAGYRYEATRIQMTCESDTDATVINGSVYMCVNEQTAVEIGRRLKEHGA